MNKRTAAPSPVASVAKGIAALRSFVDGQDEWGVRELAAALKLPPSTAHRLLARLLLEGFVSYDGKSQKYGVGFEFTRLASAIMHRQGFSSAALPVMQEITDRTGEGVWLALFDPHRDRLAYIAETKSTHTLRYLAPIGRALHLSESACGTAVLASLWATDVARTSRAGGGSEVRPDEIAAARANGYATMRAREVDSATVIAAAVLDESGAPVGSLGIVVPLARLEDGQEVALGAVVREAAQRVSSRLGFKLLGGASVGSWMEGATVISDLIGRTNPSLAMLPALGGGVRNLEHIQVGSAAYGLTLASSIADAREARHQFKRKLTDLRTVMHLSELCLVIAVRSHLKVRDVDSLARLRISPGEQGFSAAQTYEDVLAATRNADRRRPSRLTSIYLDYPEAKRQLDAGTIDGIVWMTSFSNPSLRELVSSGSIRLIAPDEDTIGRMVSRNVGYRVGTIPRHLFPEPLKADITTITVPTALVCRADRDGGEVCEVARTIYEQRALLGQISSAYSRLGPDFVLDGLTAPIHPGAGRYFGEVSILPRYANAAPESESPNEARRGRKGKASAPREPRRSS
ncbi:TAXI family TRAP transporter solute-binding subunit [uncultured Enterovirga sp.]|uniref:TAXI family TRAP transporter solute-binding subunit n=1 Tax=uncultured Enterovirga sp. TaxID=2026352 RepID=UPI0035CBAC47